MATRREVVDFTTDDPDPVLMAMVSIRQERDGWVNVRPRPTDEDDQITEFAAPPSATPLGVFGRRKPITIEGTWIPGRVGRGGVDPASVGLEHPAGRFAVRQLRDGGTPLPDGWRVVNDNARRGLVLSAPEGPDPAADCAVVLQWILAAAATLAPAQVTGRWQAEVHRR